MLTQYNRKQEEIQGKRGRHKKMCGLGIDVGTGSISLAVLKDGKLIYEAYRLHKGQIGETLTEMLAELKEECPGERFYAVASSAVVYLYPKIGKEAVPARTSA